MQIQFSWKKLPIAKKMAAGFTVMAFFTFAALSIAITGLYSLHSTAKKIARHDLVLITSADLLRDLLQELDAIVDSPQYSINPALLAEFRSHDAAFRNTLNQIRDDMPPTEVAGVNAQYGRYLSLAEQSLAGDDTSREYLRAVSADLMERLHLFEATQHALVEQRMARATREEDTVVAITLSLAGVGFLLAVMVGMVTTFKISQAMEKLKNATGRIAEGDFEHDPRIPDQDEIGELARSFAHMAQRLKDLERCSLDASPLTRLPGNIAIERALNQRLHHGTPFAFCYADLDNFKAYNDRYGYLKGSEVIKLTAQIILEAVSGCGEEHDFVGHVGGDDFVMVVEQHNIDSICRTIIERFDAMIVQHYSEEDLAAGCIQGVDRYGSHRVFPIMTISIAVLICGHGMNESALDIARAATDIKEHVKGQPGSTYLVDRRELPRDSVSLAQA